MKDDHIGPIDGLNFMSLNMTDEQLDVILRAILDAMTKADAACAEGALACICDFYLSNI